MSSGKSLQFVEEKVKSQSKSGEKIVVGQL